MRARRPTEFAGENTARLRMALATGRTGRFVLDIEHSLRWHDPGRFNGYVLSQHFAGTPVDPVNLREALRAVKERAAIPALGALRWHHSEVFGAAAMPSGIGGAADSRRTRARGPYLVESECGAVVLG